MIHGLHHVQISCPAGSEHSLREFYAGVLGMTELAKPPVLAARGGVWFRGGTAEIHCGVDADFRPARKAHPGLVCTDLDAVVTACVAAGYDVRWDEVPPQPGGVPAPPGRSNLPGFRRCYVTDPVGNRLELLQPS